MAVELRVTVQPTPGGWQAWVRRDDDAVPFGYRDTFPTEQKAHAWATRVVADLLAESDSNDGGWAA